MLVRGTEGADVVTGGDEGDTLYGFGGNDTLRGGAGDDVLAGHEGNDKLYGGDGDDYLLGGPGDDLIDGGAGVDWAAYEDATAGVKVDLNITGVQDTGGGGRDTLVGIENLYGSDFNDTLTGNAENNVLVGAKGNDTLYGLAGDDTLDGGASNDILDGGDGDDWLMGGAGDDIIRGGAGNDWASYEGAKAGVTADLTKTGQQDTVGDGKDTLSGIENLYGSDFNDTLTGDAGINVLVGGKGNDTLHGLAGDDTLDGGDGNDVLDGGDGDDWLVGGAGDDIIRGGAGSDWASYEGAKAGVTADLTKTGQQDTVGDGKDTLTGIENLWGSAFDDVLIGDANANNLQGGAGDDKLYGGAGDDHLSGGTGNNLIDGGEGWDTVDYRFSDVGVTIDLSMFVAPGGSPPAGDWLISIEAAIGSEHDDVMTGNAYENYLFGGGGNDTLRAMSGGDTLDGGDGDDILYSSGFGAPDLLLGGAGDDRFMIGGSTAVIYGGEGNDTLVSTSTSSVKIDLNITGLQTIWSLGGGAISSAVELHEIENLVGNVGDDHLIGDGKDNILTGGFGDDILDGGAGSDTASYAGDAMWTPVVIDLGKSVQTQTGNRGTDTFISIENVIGTAFNDEITGNSEVNRLQGGAGDDRLTAVGGNDLLEGGDGNDTLIASKDDQPGDRLFGGAGNDTLITQKGAALLDGGDGDDIFVVTHAPSMAGVTAIDGGAGLDTLDMRSAIANLKIDLSLIGPQDVGGGHLIDLTRIEAVVGGGGNDQIKGDAGDNWLQGGAGDDIIDGGAGFDFVRYDDPDFLTGVKVDLRNTVQTELGGRGVDTLISIEGIRGTAYADTLIGNDEDNIFVAGGGDDRIEGGGGFDYISFENDGFERGAHIGLRNQGQAQLTDRGTKTLVSIEGVIGSNYNDYFIGSAGADVLKGGMGDDDLVGGGGADTLEGGSGNDTLTAYFLEAGTLLSSTGTVLRGGDGDDRIEFGLGGNRGEGGAGADMFFIDNLAGDKVVDGGEGHDTIQFAYRVGVGLDYLSGITVDLSRTDKQQVAAGVTVTLNSVESVNGSSGNDTIIGNAGANVLSGGNGDDILEGRDGNDVIFGGAGDDILVGGRGSDILVGGLGADTYKFAAGDTQWSRDSENPWASTETVVLDKIQGWEAEDRLSFGSVDVIRYNELTTSSWLGAMTIAPQAMATQNLNRLAIQVGGDIYVFSTVPGSTTGQIESVVKLVSVGLDAIGAENFI